MLASVGLEAARRRRELALRGISPEVAGRRISGSLYAMAGAQTPAIAYSVRFAIGALGGLVHGEGAGVGGAGEFDFQAGDVGIEFESGGD